VIIGFRTLVNMDDMLCLAWVVVGSCAVARMRRVTIRTVALAARVVENHLVTIPWISLRHVIAA